MPTDWADSDCYTVYVNPIPAPAGTVIPVPTPRQVAQYKLDIQVKRI